jgi:hypothetical protein
LWPASSDAVTILMFPLLEMVTLFYKASAAAVTAALVGPTLQLLGPAALHVYKQEDVGILEKKSAWLTLSSWVLGLPGAIEQQSAPATAAAGNIIVRQAFQTAFQQQPRTCRAVLEAALRGFGGYAELNDFKSLGNTPEEQILCNFCSNKDWLLQLACKGQPAAASPAAGAAVTAAAGAAAGAAGGPSLLVSCIKLFEAVQSVQAPFTWQTLELAVQAAAISCAAAETAQQPQQQQQQQHDESGTGATAGDATSAAAAAAGWHWLCGRCLVLAGNMMQQCGSELDNRNASVLQVPVQCTSAEVLQSIAAAVQAIQNALRDQLNAAAAALPAGVESSRQQLLAALTAAGDATRSSSSSSSSSSRQDGRSPANAVSCMEDVSMAAAAAAGTLPGQQQLGPQLVAFGRAVCAVSPSSQCRNNPCCSSRAQLSEAALVGGKSCRCSACKVARYCSRDCQVRLSKKFFLSNCTADQVCCSAELA